MNPFNRVFRFSVGDLIAKTVYFCAFVYLARVLGVTSYGTLEFAIAILTYVLLLADGGLEVWATRTTAEGKHVTELAGRILSLRIVMSLAAFGALLLMLSALQISSSFRLLLTLFSLSLFTQALSLKWVFMGQEKMERVVFGLISAQILFAAATPFLVRTEADLLWVPLLRIAGDLLMVVYFGSLFRKQHGSLKLDFSLRRSSPLLRQALPMGASHGLALASHNLDSLLLGLILGPRAVGWYTAAYKPLNAMLAVPVAYFLGLLPMLSRTRKLGTAPFRETVTRSLRLTSLYAIPVTVATYLFAHPLMDLLFGAAYLQSVPVLQILSWSALLVILRGTYRQALNAAGKQDLDLHCAILAVAVNVFLNLILIPRFGTIGAAWATLISETVWFISARLYFSRHVVRTRLWPILVKPAAAAGAMAAYVLLLQQIFWIWKALTAPLVYFFVLLLLREPEVESWLPGRKSQALREQTGGIHSEL